MKKLIFPLLALCMTSFSQNPIVPPGVYIADPAAHTWSDGRLYVYGSLDESPDYYCSRRYHVLSTGDLAVWQLHEDVFATVGDHDEVDYNDNILYAPDCMEQDGKFYLYYCQPDRQHAEGVAVSDHPAGPFREGSPMDVGGYNQIDPGVFIDDDGTAYYIWGQFTMKIAKLNASMTGLVPGTIRDSILTEEEHFFHEGAFMTKRNGTYYLVYADMSRGSTPTCIGYATSTTPTGPYTYGGVIVDNDHSDPSCWNNHGSICEFNGKWYVFYHRPTHNSRMMRKACVEPITFLEDGSIPEVEMTSQGAGAPLDAYKEIDAARACWMFGTTRIELVEPGNEALVECGHDDRAAYKYIDFGDQGPAEVTMRVRPGEKPGVVILKTGYPWKPGFAEIKIPAANGSEDWIEVTAKTDHPPTGVQALWLQFWGDGSSKTFGAGVDWMKFR